MRVLAALVLTTLAAPAFAQGPAQVPTMSLASDTESRWVAFDLTPQNQIRFTLDLDGVPISAMLDTAVSHSAIARGQAARMKLKVRDQGSAVAIGGRIAIGWADARSIAFGGLRRTGGRLAVTDLPDSVAMLVGADLVAGFALDIDYPGRRFRLLQSGRMPFPGATMPLRIGTDMGFYLGEMELHGLRIRPMVIDTGDGGAITVTTDAWQAHRSLAPRMTTTISHGLAGPAIAELTILPELKLGSLTAHDVELNIEGADGYSRRIGVAGRIGSGFLRHYRVLIDPSAGHMLMSAGPDADMSPVRSTSGLLVVRESEALVVQHVMKGGPGEAAGWRAGERICSVDGVSPPSGDWTAGEPGRTVTLGLCDGGVKNLTLAAYY